VSDRVIIKGQQFDALMAITSDEVASGLMYKSWPPPVMAFPFVKADVRKFWMKNTTSPLDIVFCRAGKIIGIFAGTPLSLEHIGPDEPCDLVVEFPRGTVARNRIAVGDSVKLSYSVSTMARRLRNYYLTEKV
jgi:uncharacterized membrane protein (UPF0127 family)